MRYGCSNVVERRHDNGNAVCFKCRQKEVLERAKNRYYKSKKK